MTEPTLLTEGIRTARKKHQCFDCYRPIYPRERYKFTTCTMDGSSDFDDGFPPLADMIDNCGEFEADMALLRGRFPHVVCRMEFTQKIAEINYQKRRA